MKNCNYLLFCMLILSFGCDRDSKSLTTGSKHGSAENTQLKVAIDSSYSYDQFKESIVKAYVDSLNSFKAGSKIPIFLMDSNLDLSSEINSWPNSNFVSLREEIFKKVENVELLNEIIRTSFFKHQFEGIEKKRPRIPSDETNNYVLAQERLKALAN